MIGIPFDRLERPDQNAQLRSRASSLETFGMSVAPVGKKINISMPTLREQAEQLRRVHCRISVPGSITNDIGLPFQQYDR